MNWKKEAVGVASKQKTCAKCGRRFTPAPSGRTRKCCYVCRPLPHQADPFAGRIGVDAAPAPVEPDALPVDVPPGRYELRARKVLEQKGALETMAGEIALGLARSMDATTLKPTEVVSLGASLLKTLDQAVAAAPHVPDKQDARAARAAEIAASA